MNGKRFTKEQIAFALRQALVRVKPVHLQKSADRLEYL